MSTFVSGTNMVKIGPGEHFVTQEQGLIITTVLGSCIAACIRDPVAKVGGMNHFMLPDSERHAKGWGGDDDSMRYGNVAMERLINALMQRGARRSRMEVKVFGGGAVMGTSEPVGYRNAEFVEAYLRAEGLPIIARDLRGHTARRLRFHVLTGRVQMQHLPMNNAAALDGQEARYRASLRQSVRDSDIELFD